MNWLQWSAWFERMFVGLSHRYFVRYTDSSGYRRDCAWTPGPTFAECSVAPYSELPDETQQAIAAEFLAMLSRDPVDHHFMDELHSEAAANTAAARREAAKAVEALAEYEAASVGLSQEELDYASGTEYQRSAASQFEAFQAGLLEQWAAEDAAEEAADDLLERKRCIIREAAELAHRYPGPLGRAGLAAPIFSLCRGGIEAISDEALPEAERLLRTANGAVCSPNY